MSCPGGDGDGGTGIVRGKRRGRARRRGEDDDDDGGTAGGRGAGREGR